MKKLFHAYWQVVVVAFFTAVLALQIPRRALFFAPRERIVPAAYASFIEIEPQVYSNMIDKVRMSWQQRIRGTGQGFDSRVGEFAFADPLPPPEYLPREAGQASRPESLDVAAHVRSAALLPPSLALPHLSPLPAPAVRSGGKGPDPDLLQVPDSLGGGDLP
ncbi:MAG: hypothetical protein ACI4Q3_06540 [Kiritimatiellia bacterium]